jgi:hypothetical protein
MHFMLILYVVFPQLIRYARLCSVFDKFLNQREILTNNSILQEFQQSRLWSQYVANFMVIMTKFELPIQTVVESDVLRYISYQSICSSLHINVDCR